MLEPQLQVTLWDICMVIMHGKLLHNGLPSSTWCPCNNTDYSTSCFDQQQTKYPGVTLFFSGIIIITTIFCFLAFPKDIVGSDLFWLIVSLQRAQVTWDIHVVCVSSKMPNYAAASQDSQRFVVLIVLVKQQLSFLGEIQTSKSRNTFKCLEQWS